MGPLKHSTGRKESKKTGENKPSGKGEGKQSKMGIFVLFSKILFRQQLGVIRPSIVFQQVCHSK